MDEQALLKEVLQDNQAAIDLVNDLAQISQAWDDLIDGDKPLNDDAINSAFVILLSTLPRNPFYQLHLSELQPVVELVIIDWLTANQFELDPKLLPLAWILRDSMSALLITCAKIIGGMPWAIAVSPKIRQFIHDENLEDYANGKCG